MITFLPFFPFNYRNSPPSWPPRANNILKSNWKYVPLHWDKIFITLLAELTNIVNHFIKPITLFGQARKVYQIFFWPSFLILVFHVFINYYQQSIYKQILIFKLIINSNIMKIKLITALFFGGAFLYTNAIHLRVNNQEITEDGDSTFDQEFLKIHN